MMEEDQNNIVDSIVHLNVGGEIITTQRSTLCQIEDSLLFTMFINEQWQDQIDRDTDGYIFLDLNPKYFEIILDYLRTKKIGGSNNPILTKNFTVDQLITLSNLIDSLGLQHELSPNKAKCIFKLHSKWIRVLNDHSVAVHDGYNSGIGYVLSSNVYQSGLTRWRLLLESVQRDIFVGMLHSDCEPYDDKSYDMRGSFGWLLCQGHDVIRSAIYDGWPKYDFIPNLKITHVIELVLNCNVAKLTLILSPYKEFHIFLPESPAMSTSWRLHINLFQQNDKIRILAPHGIT